MHPSPSPAVLTPVLPLDQVGHGRESEVDAAQLLLTLIQFKAHVIYHPSTLHPYHYKKSCGDGRATKATGVGTLAVVAADLHVGDSGQVVALY